MVVAVGVCVSVWWLSEVCVSVVRVSAVLRPVCLPLRVRPRVCPVPVLRFCGREGGAVPAFGPHFCNDFTKGLKAEPTPVDRRLNMAFLCTLSSFLLDLVMGRG